MHCSSFSTAASTHQVSGHGFSETLAETSKDCLTKYIPSSRDSTVSTEALTARLIAILARHGVQPKLREIPLLHSNMSCSIERINAFFNDTNDFDMERYKKLHDEYWACVGDSRPLTVREHFDLTIAIAERFMADKLPDKLFIEQEPCHFQHIKSMSGVLSKAFLLLNRGCALVMVNGVDLSEKKAKHPQFESFCFLLTWEQSRQGNSPDRVQLFDLNIELQWLRGKHDSSETCSAFQNRFLHDVADYAGFMLRKANMTHEEIRLLIVHERAEYRDLAGSVQEPDPGTC